MSQCKHEEIEFHIESTAFEDAVHMTFDMRARCTGCGTVFRFLGVPEGAGGGGPTTGIWHDVVELPVVCDLPAAVWDQDGGPLSDADRAAIDKALNRKVDTGVALSIQRTDFVPSPTAEELALAHLLDALAEHRAKAPNLRDFWPLLHSELDSIQAAMNTGLANATVDLAITSAAGLLRLLVDLRGCAYDTEPQARVEVKR